MVTRWLMMMLVVPMTTKSAAIAVNMSVHYYMLANTIDWLLVHNLINWH